MATIGARLRAAREEKGIRLSQVSAETKIHSKVLTALEEDRCQEVLNAVYARSFLKKYALYLDLDSDSMVKEFRTLHPVSRTQETETTKVPSQHNTYPLEPGQKSKVFLMLTMGFISLLVIFLMYQLAVGIRTIISSRRTSGHSSVAKPRILWAEKSSVSDRAPVITPGHRPESGTGEQRAIPRKEVLRLTIKASEQVWMEVKSDGNVVFNNTLSKGGQKTWEAKDTIELWVGNAGALSLNLNGKPLEPLGRGVMKGIMVTHGGVKLRNQ
jgi:cytoskeletal protein RodZ